MAEKIAFNMVDDPDPYATESELKDYIEDVEQLEQTPEVKAALIEAKRLLRSK